MEVSPPLQSDVCALVDTSPSSPRKGLHMQCTHTLRLKAKLSSLQRQSICMLTAASNRWPITSPNGRLAVSHGGKAQMGSPVKGEGVLDFHPTLSLARKSPCQQFREVGGTKIPLPPTSAQPDGDLLGHKSWGPFRMGPGGGRWMKCFSSLGISPNHP